MNYVLKGLSYRGAATASSHTKCCKKGRKSLCLHPVLFSDDNPAAALSWLSLWKLSADIPTWTGVSTEPRVIAQPGVCRRSPRASAASWTPAGGPGRTCRRSTAREPESRQRSAAGAAGRPWEPNREDWMRLWRSSGKKWRVAHLHVSVKGLMLNIMITIKNYNLNFIKLCCLK